MIVVYIVCGIALLLILFIATIIAILNMRIKIVVSCVVDSLKSADALIYATIGPYKKILYPEKEEKLKLSDFSAKKYRQLIEDDAARQSKIKVSSPGDASSEEGSLSEVLHTLKLVFNLLKTFKGYLRCEISRVKLTVGTKDAAVTALSYTALTSAVHYIIEFIDNNIDLRLKSPKDVYVHADFNKNVIDANIKFVFSISILDFFRAGGSLSEDFLDTGLPSDKKDIFNQKIKN